MRGIVAVTGSAADNCLAIFRGEAFPEDGRPPGVNFRGNEDDAVQIFLAKSLPEGAHFVGGIYDGWRKNVNGAIRNTLMKQKHTVVEFLAGIGNGKLFERGAGFDGIGEPDLRGVPLVKKARGFERARRHAAAENGDRGRFLRGIFPVEPAAQVEEGEQQEKEKRAQNQKPGARLAGPSVRKDGREEHLDREIIRSNVAACAASW